MGIIKREKLIVLYGTQGQGKSTYVFDMALKNARLGHKILFYSLEMEQETMLDVICRQNAGITIQEEYDYSIPAHKTDLAEKKRRELLNEPNMIFVGERKTEDKTWESVMQKILKYANVDFLIIDNLDCIQGRKGESDNDRQARVLTDMAMFVSKFKIPIMLIHHKRKFAPNGKSQGMDDMAGSGRIARIADYVIKLSRNTDADAIGSERYKTILFMEKAREYAETVQEIYFYRGTFVDDMEQEQVKDATQIFNSQL